jgi:hypothetical protein
MPHFTQSELDALRRVAWLLHREAQIHVAPSLVFACELDDASLAILKLIAPFTRNA